MDCIKLNNNINECATTNPFRRWDEVGYILPYEDVTNVVFNGMNVKFDTIGTAFSVRDRRLNPFSGSGSEFVQGDMGSVSWTERVNFPALANSVENATIANAIANGGRVVVILKQVDYESDGKGKYQVFGIDGGLRIDTMPFDPYADAAWNVTLIAEKMSRPAVYLWDTNEAKTDAKWSLITQYEYITGLSLANGSITPQVVYLQVDSDKECKVVLPNSTTLTSTGGVINYIWRGAAGAVTLLVDKTSQKVYFGDYDNTGAIISDYIGDLYTIFNGLIQVTDCPSLTSISAPNATSLDCGSCTSLTSVSAPNATELNCSHCTSLTSVSAPNATSLDCYNCTSLTSVSAPNATYLDCSNCTSLTSVSAPNATYLYCYGCALTANAIASLLAELVVTGKTNGTLNISGGTNADFNDWSGQAQTDRATLAGRGWTITYNNAE